MDENDCSKIRQREYLLNRAG
jgi:two-component system, cell cycle response regulator CpdR